MQLWQVWPARIVYRMESREVRHEPDAHRYTLWVDGEQVGQADYELRENTIAITHTEVDPSRQGSGLGGSLVKGMLDQLAEGELRVIPACPFVATYVERHDEYKPLTTR
ncbi:Acetyltransferase [Agreia sp. COWG]|nr:Acetyltransferase [Agreia sp. COWG]